MTYLHPRNWLNPNKRAGIVAAVIIRALHENALRKKISQPHVDTDGGVEVAQHCERFRMVFKSGHLRFVFIVVVYKGEKRKSLAGVIDKALYAWVQ